MYFSMNKLSITKISAIASLLKLIFLSQPSKYLYFSPYCTGPDMMVFVINIPYLLLLFTVNNGADIGLVAVAAAKALPTAATMGIKETFKPK